MVDIHGIVALLWLATGAIVGIIGALAFKGPRRLRFRYANWKYRSHRYDERVPADLTDPAQQLKAVMAASFERRRLLSLSEYKVFRLIEVELAIAARGHRVFAQTCLGEILGSDSKDGFRSINSKRVDILVVDRGGWPLLAVEYQGGGHYQGNAGARDAVKREALRRAGVKYLEIFEGDSEDQIRRQVREQLGGTPNDDRAAASAPPLRAAG
jgi:hypothetical protein